MPGNVSKEFLSYQLEERKMKKQKIKKNGFYGATVFNLASYSLSRNYTIGGKNTKGAIAQFTAITNYLKNYKARRKDIIK